MRDLDKLLDQTFLDDESEIDIYFPRVATKSNTKPAHKKKPVCYKFKQNPNTIKSRNLKGEATRAAMQALKKDKDGV